jgi:hypothetical protein
MHADLFEETTNHYGHAQQSGTSGQRSFVAVVQRQELIFQDAAARESENHEEKYRKLLALLRGHRTPFKDGDEPSGQKPHPGTCDWLVKNEEMVTWVGVNPHCTKLWVYGKPGAGKQESIVVISAWEVDMTRQKCAQHLPDRTSTEHWTSHNHFASVHLPGPLQEQKYFVSSKRCLSATHPTQAFIHCFPV